MQKKLYTVEDLMLDDSFLSYCLDKSAPRRIFWEKEIEAHSDQKAVFAEAKYTIILLHGKLDDSEVNREVEKIKMLVRRAELKHSPAQKRGELFSSMSDTSRYTNKKFRKYFRKAYVAYSIAASIVLFFGAYLLKYQGVKPIAQQPKPTEVSYNSNLGERKSVQLPDGSVVILNSNSSVTFGGNFNQNDRSVILTGEAFFRVAKNPAKPFTVNSGAFSVRAIGTSFYVYARNNERDYKVDLIDGKVKLMVSADKIKTTGTETILQPGEEGAWQPSDRSFTKAFCDSTVLKKWLTGKLSFKSKAVQDVLDLLQQWYGVDIIVKHKKWDTLKLTGDYDNKPLDEVLKVICFSLSATCSYSGNQVIIE